MTDQVESVLSLVEAADAAYQVYRRDVVDTLAPNEPLDGPGLSAHQRRVTARFHLAEHELVDYREARYATQHGQLVHE